jgi:holliday junction DNA helicase RuvA
MTSGGVAYKIHINEYTYGKISLLEEVFLHVYHHFTQDAQSLFGFVEAKEKALFTELLKISGIGGKA